MNVGHFPIYIFLSFFWTTKKNTQYSIAIQTPNRIFQWPMNLLPDFICYINWVNVTVMEFKPFSLHCAQCKGIISFDLSHLPYRITSSNINYIIYLLYSVECETSEELRSRRPIVFLFNYVKWITLNSEHLKCWPFFKVDAKHCPSCRRTSFKINEIHSFWCNGFHVMLLNL